MSIYVPQLVITPDGTQTETTVEITDAELAAQAAEQAAIEKTSQIEALKAQLAATDYKAIKYSEGWITAEDYAPIKAERQAMRVQIDALSLE